MYHSFCFLLDPQMLKPLKLHLYTLNTIYGLCNVLAVGLYVVARIDKTIKLEQRNVNI